MASLHLKQPDGSVNAYELSAEVTTIGRHPQSLIVIEETTASGHHAEILKDEEDYILRDTGSANGTFVNGARLEQETKLAHGDIIHFAGAEAVFRTKGDDEEKPESLREGETPAARGFAASIASKLKDFGKLAAKEKAAAPVTEPAPAITEKSAARDENPASAMMIHTVFFWLKPNLTAEQLAKFDDGVRSLARIASVEAAYFGKPSETDRPVIDRTYSFGLTILFKNREAHDAYQLDPLHLAFTEGCRALWNRVVIYDFDHEPVPGAAGAE